MKSNQQMEGQEPEQREQNFRCICRGTKLGVKGRLAGGREECFKLGQIDRRGRSWQHPIAHGKEFGSV